VDITGYYFPGYPVVPSDAVIRHVKRRAFLLGLDMGGTGVRNDFSVADRPQRQADVALVKAWIRCAAKLGAPYVRVFAGRTHPEGYTWDQVARWMADDFRTCADYGKEYGVMVALQNHNAFIKMADQIEVILGMVDSDWFGLMLDIGSLRQGDPYAEIAQVTPYAVSWQIKELVYRDGQEERLDIQKLLGIIRQADYRGYLPLETLGEGDPYAKMTRFLAEVRAALG